MPRARDGLSVSRVQDFAEKALVPKLDSYNQTKSDDSLHDLENEMVLDNKGILFTK